MSIYWILGAVCFGFAIVVGVVEYLTEIKPEFRKKLPEHWQKRIEDILKPEDVTSEETSKENS